MVRTHGETRSPALIIILSLRMRVLVKTWDAFFSWLFDVLANRLWAQTFFLEICTDMEVRTLKIYGSRYYFGTHCNFGRLWYYLLWSRSATHPSDSVTVDTRVAFHPRVLSNSQYWLRKSCSKMCTTQLVHWYTLPSVIPFFIVFTRGLELVLDDWQSSKLGKLARAKRCLHKSEKWCMRWISDRSPSCCVWNVRSDGCMMQLTYLWQGDWWYPRRLLW